MGIEASYYPNLEHGSISDRAIFNKKENPHYFYLISGTGAGGAKASEAATKLLEKNLSQHTAFLVECQNNPTIDHVEEIQTRLYTVINAVNSELSDVLIKDAIGHASVTIDLLVFAGNYAVVVHVGNNRIMYIKDNYVVSMTKEQSKYTKEVSDLERIGFKEKIGQIVDAIGKKDIPSSRLGHGEISKISIVPIVLCGNDSFLIVTQKFTQSLKIELGAIEKDTLSAFAEKDLSKGARLLYDRAQVSVKNPDVGVMMIRHVDTSGRFAELSKRLELLSKIELFQDIKNNPTAMHKICAITNEVDFKKDELLIEQGKPSSSFFIILNNSARVLIDGKENFTVYTNDAIGEGSVVCDEPYFTTAIANSDLKALEVKKMHLSQLFSRDLELSIKIQKRLSKSLAKKAVSLAKSLSSIKDFMKEVFEKINRW